MLFSSLIFSSLNIIHYGEKAKILTKEIRMSTILYYSNDCSFFRFQELFQEELVLAERVQFIYLSNKKRRDFLEGKYDKSGSDN
jgi:hypothetical protein